MKSLPDTNDSLVLRTDFSDDAAWEYVCEEVQRPVGGFQAYVECVSDPDFKDASVEQLMAAGEGGQWRSFLFVVDSTTLSQAEHPVLVIGLRDEERGRTFRVIPSEMWAVENNLSLANMDFRDFADSVDGDGIFRGFPGGPAGGSTASAAQTEAWRLMMGQAGGDPAQLSTWSKLVLITRWLIKDLFRRPR